MSKRTSVLRSTATCRLLLPRQLEGKKGAIVVLNPQTGDILAMYSNPSFNLSEAQNLEDYLNLEGNKRDKPLLNRATREFYVPGLDLQDLHDDLGVSGRKTKLDLP